MDDPIETTAHMRLQSVLTKLRREFPDSDARWIAERAVAHLKRHDLREVVMHYAVEQVWTARRQDARRVEQNAYNRSVYVPKAERAVRPRVSIAEAMAELQTAVRLEITAELLATTFALGDGRQTTWGQATIEQHRQRADALIGQGMGTLQTAALHEAAIEMIQANGVERLSDVRVAA